MNPELTNIVSEIKKMATHNNTSEEHVLKQLNDHYKKLKHAEFVDAYLKRNQKVSEICKSYKMSPKRLYKILKEEGIEIKAYKKS